MSLIREGQCFLRDARFLLSHQNAGRASVINFAEIDSVIRKMGCQNLHALAFEMSDGIANGAVCFHLYPAVTTRRCRSHGAHAATSQTA